MKKTIRRFMLFFLIVSLSWTITACNKKDNGVSPVPQSPGPDGIPPTGGVHVSSFMVDGLPASFTKYLTIEPGFQSKIRANVYPDPKGKNLALQGRGQIWIPSPIYIGGYEGFGWRPPIWEIDTTPFLGFDIRNLVDGDPATGIWLSGSQQQWPLQIASTWETPQIISRVYVVTQQVQGFQLCTDDNFDNFHPTPLNGSIIDINLDPPVVTSEMGLFLSGSNCGIMEYGLYGPQTVKPRVTKIEFSGSALNKIFDRKNHQFLDPPHWLANVQNGQVAETKNSSFSYVIDSPISLKPEFVSEDGTPLPANSSFDVELTGQVKDLIGAEPDRTITFPTTSWSGSPIEMTSKEALQTKVGIWGLELNWIFKKNGAQLSNQRTPQATTYHCVLTTWGKTIENAFFGQTIARCDGSSKKKAESNASQYLEVLEYSCQFAHGANQITPGDLLAVLKQKTWTSNLFHYLGRTVFDGEERGIDRFLEEKSGWCEEVSQFFRALGNSQGIECGYYGAIVDMEYYEQGWRLVVSNLDFPALGGDTQRNVGHVWNFKNHAYVGAKNIAYYDLSFGKQNLLEDDLLNEGLDLGKWVLEEQDFNILDTNPAPTYLHFYSEF